MFEDEVKKIEDIIYKDDADYEAIIDSLDAILVREPSNQRAMELKYFASFAGEHYEQCASVCNDVIVLDNLNIDARMFKANSFFRTEKYLECADVCREILRIEPDNKDAAELLENANAMKALNDLDVLDTEHVKDEPEEILPSEYKPIKNVHKYRFVNFMLWMILFVLPALWVYFYHPVSEYMSCNKMFRCKISQSYYWNFKRNSSVILSDKFYFVKRTFSIPETNGTRYNTYPVYKLSNGRKFSPFRYYITSSENKKKNDLYMNYEYQKFSRYISNPRSGYSVRSKANKKSINQPFIYYLIYVIALFVLNHVLSFVGSLISNIKFNIAKSKRKKKPSNKKDNKSKKKLENDIVDLAIEKIPDVTEEPQPTEEYTLQDDPSQEIANAADDDVEIIYKNPDDEM